MVTSDAGVFIALGSNLGDRADTLDSAIASLAAEPGIRVLKRSTFHETDPLGGPPGQGRYLNAVIEVQTLHSPRELLAILLRIERDHGRVRGDRNAPRTLDLDLLLYRDAVIDEPDLVVPHPRMWQRNFVLRPLRELCGALRFARLMQQWATDAPA